MSAKAHYFRIGVFIMSGLAVTIIGIMALSGGKWFKSSDSFETYFDESVQGLTVGSPIKYRGVQVGTVESIGFVGDVYKDQMSEEALSRYGRYVIVNLSATDLAPHLTENEKEERRTSYVTAGLRVRLAQQGITGLVYVEADYLDPKEYPPLEMPWTPRTTYLPSAPSTVMVLSTALVNLAKNLEKSDVHKLVTDLDLLLLDAAKFMKEAHLAELTGEAVQAVAEFHETARQARRILVGPQFTAIVSDTAATMQEARRFAGDLAQASKQIRSAVEKFPDDAIRLERSIGRVDSLIANKSQDVEETLENLRMVSENLRELTHNVKRYPAQLFLGAPPPRTDSARR